MKFGVVLLFVYCVVSNGFFLPVTRFLGSQLGSKKKSENGEFDLALYEKEREVYVPKTTNQQKYLDYLGNRNVSIVLGIGPAGSGKTLFACSTAVKELKAGYVDHIVITRPLISVDEELGFLPGSLEDKMDPWTRPIFDALSEFYPISQIKSMVHNGIIEISPLAFMRGRTFKRSFIIADEMQNSSPNQMKMMLTRLGDGSRMTITGDLNQSDRSTDNGLSDFMTRLRRFDSSENDTFVKYVELQNEDIQRSLAVSHVLQIYEKEFTEKKPSRNSNYVASPPVRSINNDAAMIPRTQYDIGYI